MKLLILLSLLILSVVYTKKMKTSTNYWIRPLIKTAKSYISFANLPYCNIDAIQTLACPLCSSILDGSFNVYKAEKIRKYSVDFKYVILYSPINQEIIISFSGPKSTDNRFYKKLWVDGFSQFHDLSIESAYVKIYHKLSKYIKENLEELSFDHPEVEDFKFIFVGHSFGGSLAVLAAYDLISTQYIKQTNAGGPIVYTYGLLRIGDSDFVNKVNSTVKVIRFIKENDYMTRGPNCVPNESNLWKCYETEEELIKREPEYKTYIMHNIAGYAKPGPVVAWNSSDARRSSFLERKGVYFSQNNPGYGVNTWGFGLNANESKNGIFYSQPIGAEVLFSPTFDRHRVCQYFNGVPNCEKTVLPDHFNPMGHSEYFGYNIEDC